MFRDQFSPVGRVFLLLPMLGELLSVLGHCPLGRLTSLRGLPRCLRQTCRLVLCRTGCVLALMQDSGSDRRLL